MSKILGIDPGNIFSAFVIWDTESQKITDMSQHLSMSLSHLKKNYPEYDFCDIKKYIDKVSGKHKYIKKDKSGKEYLLFKNKFPNMWIRKFMGNEIFHHIGIEMINCMGMAIGKTTMETIFWIGRFYEMFYQNRLNKSIKRIYRHEIKTHFCGTPKAKDGNIRQVLIDRFGEPGTKKFPGKLYGVSQDIWQALAVAIYINDEIENKVQK